MNIKIHAKTRDGSAFANAIYTGTNTIVLPGGRVKTEIAQSVRGGTFVKRFLNDRNFVSEDGDVLQECVFNSPSIAAMFVTGNASNGYIIWKLENGKTLGDYLKENNLR